MGKLSKLVLFKNAVNSKHGVGTIGHANTVQVIPRVSTGSISFDRALGGGIPLGRISLFRGPESSGKTEKTYRVLGIAQNLCSNCHRPVSGLKIEYDEENGWEAHGHCDCYAGGLCDIIQYPDEKKEEFAERKALWSENSYREFRVVLFDMEGAFEIEWAEKLGLDTRRMLYVRPDTAEEAVDICDELIRTGEVDMIAVDSLAAMTPSIEVSSSSEDQNIAMQARILSRFCRRVVASSGYVSREYKRLVTHIWINQERDKIEKGMGQGWGDKSVMPGGHAQKFAASVIVKMWASKWQTEQQDPGFIKDLQSEIGTKVRMNFKTIKNKTAPARQTGSYDMFISGGEVGEIDEFKYVIAMAEKYGMYRVEGEGTNKKWFIGDEKYDRKAQAMDRFKDPDVYGHTRQTILNFMLGIK